MKKSILALTLIASTISGAALAHDGAYVSAAYSKMHYDQFIVSNEVENGYNLAAGYDFAIGSMFTLGAELEYKNLGSTTESLAGDSFKMGLTSYGLNIVPRVYFGDSFNMFAKLGYHNVTADFGGSVADSVDEESNVSDTASVLGFGIAYDFTPNFALQTSYELHNIAMFNTASANFGIKYKF